MQQQPFRAFFEARNGVSWPKPGEGCPGRLCPSGIPGAGWDYVMWETVADWLDRRAPHDVEDGSAGHDHVLNGA